MTSSVENANSAQKAPGVYAIEHQRSFRTAFDFLTSHFPPGSTPEWWEKTAQDVSDASLSMGGDKLTVGLLLGVFNYLEDEFIRREAQS